jgi:hypothetical protein
MFAVVAVVAVIAVIAVKALAPDIAVLLFTTDRDGSQVVEKLIENRGVGFQRDGTDLPTGNVRLGFLSDKLSVMLGVL